MLRGIWIEGKGDLEPVYALRDAIWTDENRRDAMDVWSRHLIITENETAIAVGTMTENLHHNYQLYDVGVLKEYQNQGIGDFLVKVLINEIWEKGGLSIEITATEDSRSFFMKQGFLESGRNETGIKMKRVL